MAVQSGTFPLFAPPPANYWRGNDFVIPPFSQPVKRPSTALPFSLQPAMAGGSGGAGQSGGSAGSLGNAATIAGALGFGLPLLVNGTELGGLLSKIPGAGGLFNGPMTPGEQALVAAAENSALSGPPAGAAGVSGGGAGVAAPTGTGVAAPLGAPASGGLFGPAELSSFAGMGGGITGLPPAFGAASPGGFGILSNLPPLSSLPADLTAVPPGVLGPNTGLYTDTTGLMSAPGILEAAGGAPTGFGASFRSALAPGFRNVAGAGLAALGPLLEGDYPEAVGAAGGAYLGGAAGTGAATVLGLSGLAGNLLLPGLGGFIGATAGKKLASQFGPGESVGPNQGGSGTVGPDGKLMRGPTGADNGANTAFSNQFLDAVAQGVNAQLAEAGQTYGFTGEHAVQLEVLGGRINIYDPQTGQLAESFAPGQVEQAYNKAVQVALNNATPEAGQRAAQRKAAADAAASEAAAATDAAARLLRPQQGEGKIRQPQTPPSLDDIVLAMRAPGLTPAQYAQLNSLFQRATPPYPAAPPPLPFTPPPQPQQATAYLGPQAAAVSPYIDYWLTPEAREAESYASGGYGGI